MTQVSPLNNIVVVVRATICSIHEHYDRKTKTICSALSKVLRIRVTSIYKYLAYWYLVQMVADLLGCLVWFRLCVCVFKLMETTHDER